MSEKTFDLPDGIEEDGQTWWGPRVSSVITVGNCEVFIDEAVCGDYSAARVREFALALLAAADASEVGYV